MRQEFPRNLRYSPVNWLVVNWGFKGRRFNDCGLPEPKPCKEPKPGQPEVCVPLPVREAIETYDWERFLPEIMVGIDEPDEDIAANYAREAAIDFAKRARVLQRQIAIPIQPDVCTYPIEPYEGENIIGVIGTMLDGHEPCGCQNHCQGILPDGTDFRVDLARNELHLENRSKGCGCCKRKGILRILVWSAPAEDACEYDKFLYDHYRKDITLLARRNYIVAMHFRDKDLIRTVASENTYETAVSSAKIKSMMPHSWTAKTHGSGMWGNNNPFRRGGYRRW